MYQASNGLQLPADEGQPTYAPSPSPQGQWRVLNGARRAPRRAIPRMWWVGILGMLTAVLVIYVHTVNQEFRLSRMKDDLRRSTEQLTVLRSVKAGLENPRNIDEKARKTLAMQAPQDVVFMSPPTAPTKSLPNRIPMAPAVIHEGF